MMNSLTPDVMEFDAWTVGTEGLEGHIANDLKHWGHSEATAEEIAKRWMALRKKYGDQHLDWLWEFAVEHLIKLEEDAPKPLPRDAFIDYEQNDHANAKLFVRKYGAFVRYCAAWGKWLVWAAEGEEWGRWVVDETERVMAFARTIPEDMKAWVADAEDEKVARAREGWRQQCGNATRLKAMLELARGDASISVSPEQLDADGWLLNCQSGTVQLKDIEYKHEYEKMLDRGGRSREPRKSDLITKMANASVPVGIWEYEDVCPNWMAFLDRIFAGDKEVIEFMQRLVGYSATGLIKEHVLVFLWGTGANGKSTFVNTIMDVLGDYASTTAPNLLIKPQGTQHPTAIADLYRRRLVITVEQGDGVLAESLAKQLTGGDRIKARRLYHDFFEFSPTHKIWIFGNYLPVIEGTDYGIWRRVLFIQFPIRIPEEEWGTGIEEELLKERDGILYWIVQGCLKWQREGLNPPASVSLATQELKEVVNVLELFLADVCVRGEDRSIRAQYLYDTYVDWAQREGAKVLSATMFGKKLKEMGFKQYRDGKGRKWVGLDVVYKGADSISV